MVFAEVDEIGFICKYHQSPKITEKGADKSADIIFCLDIF